MKIPENMLFLKAPRFWMMIVGALSVYAESKEWIGESERNLLATISVLFIGVQTVDRATEHLGKTEVEAAAEVKAEKNA